MTETLNYITIPDWNERERAREADHSKKAKLVLEEADFDKNPLETRKRLEAFIIEIEQNVAVAPIDGAGAVYDYPDMINRLKFFVEASNDPELADMVPGGLLYVIPEERGLRQSFELLSVNEKTAGEFVHAIDTRVRAYEEAQAEEDAE